MKKSDPWKTWRQADGTVDFDAMPPHVRRAFAREGERAAGRPLSAAQRREFASWRKRAGRPRVGEGFQRWNISLEKQFARRVAAYAKSHGISRSRALAEGAKLLLSKVA